MRSRKVTVKVFHYPLKSNSVPAMFSLFFDDMGEILDYEVSFVSDRPLEEILSSQTLKTKDYATMIDDIFWYRIVVHDIDGRLVKIFKT